MRKIQPQPDQKLATQIRELFGPATIMYETMGTEDVLAEMKRILTGEWQTIRIYLGQMVTREVTVMETEPSTSKKEIKEFRKALLARLELADLNPNFWKGAVTEAETIAWGIKQEKLAMKALGTKMPIVKLEELVTEKPKQAKKPKKAKKVKLVEQEEKPEMMAMPPLEQPF